MPLPNFFIAGAGKAGTTSLYSYLKQHPDIYMSPVKEPAYFAPEVRSERLAPPIADHVRRQTRALPALLHDGAPVHPHGWLARNWDDYLRLFQHADRQQAIGEASPIYLWSAEAARNIRQAIPEARIILILRDPAERAFSQYLHQLSVGLTRSTFRRHLEQCARAGHTQLSHLYPFLEIGLYHLQVKRFLDCFPPHQLRIYWYEEVWRDPAAFLSAVFTFLGVDPAFPIDTSRRSLERRAPHAVSTHYFLKKLRIWYPLRSLVPARLRPRLRRLAFRPSHSLHMEPRDRAFLVDYYRHDVQQLAQLLGRDLSAWLR